MRKKAMTLDGFLARLRRKVWTYERDSDDSFEVYSNQDLRCGDMCPITFAEGEGRSAEEYRVSAEAMQLPLVLAKRIVAASDMTSKKERRLRVRLLEAVGLL